MFVLSRSIFRNYRKNFLNEKFFIKKRLYTNLSDQAKFTENIQKLNENEKKKLIIQYKQKEELEELKFSLSWDINKYCEALFKAAKKKKMLSDVEKDSKNIITFLNSHEKILSEIQELFSMKKLLEVEEKKNLKLLSEEKMKKIREITKEDPIKQLTKHVKITTDLVLNMIRMLINQYNLKFLPYILNSYLDLMKKESGLIDVLIITAEPISEEEAKMLLSSFLEKKDKNLPINIQYKVNPAILGGFMLKVGDKFYDKSKKTIMENVLAKLQSTLPTQHNFSNLDPNKPWPGPFKNDSEFLEAMEDEYGENYVEEIRKMDNSQWENLHSQLVNDGDLKKVENFIKIRKIPANTPRL